MPVVVCHTRVRAVCEVCIGGAWDVCLGCVIGTLRHVCVGCVWGVFPGRFDGHGSENVLRPACGRDHRFRLCGQGVGRRHQDVLTEDVIGLLCRLHMSVKTASSLRIIIVTTVEKKHMRQERETDSANDKRSELHLTHTAFISQTHTNIHTLYYSQQPFQH